MDLPSAIDSLSMSRKQLDEKLQLLQQLCSQGFDESTESPSARKTSVDSDTWIHAEYQWALDEARDSAISLSSVLHQVDEEATDACMPHAYDPTLFPPPHSTLSHNNSKHQRACSDKDKPLPDIPGTPSALGCVYTSWPPSPRTPPPSPCAPGRVFSSTLPRSSASTSMFYTSPLSTRSTSLPTSSVLSTEVVRPVMPSSTTVSASRAASQRHTNYPSISSTLELLEERETEAERRAGVYVTGTNETAVDEMAAASARRGSNASMSHVNAEAPKLHLGLGKMGPKRKQRPALPALSTSVSSPQLRTLAVQSASPSLGSATSTNLPSAFTATSQKFIDASAPSTLTAAPFTRSGAMANGETDDDQQLPSRWSLDSVVSRHARASFLPVHIPLPASPTTQSPTSKGSTRDRLISFISRGRSGSLGKTLPPVIPAAEEALTGRNSLTKEPHFLMVSSRPSLSSPLTTPVNSHFPVNSSPSSSNTSSAASLPTPTDAMLDPFSATADSCIPVESAHASSDVQDFHLPDIPVAPSLPPSPPPEPTLPLPSPSMPSQSFLVPQRPHTFFSALALKRRLRRRAKKLVISGIEGPDALASVQQLRNPHDEAERERRIEERRRRLTNVVHWCESFGALRKVERKDDGSLHVYWRQWEVADMVCRVQAQVYIKEVGRVNLAWHYIS
ncbi:hypothetical protein SCP_1103050 [Sparassis crispa]|uniref:Uncharacterized protein n=1 Tax=Sparassis crispa TaxID=139825 RepID=A0A401GZP8_9APHY|nr:hypothetical protein SCP_1103050 [Sparassis crispa]GBE87628.1 hypothetical protein SCP_1103050 [Sparassis crispa]